MFEGKLTRFQRDTLKEVGHIGASSASTALSKMTGKMILVEMTELQVMSVNDVLELFPDSKDNIVGISFNVEGEITGVMDSLATKKTALLLSDMIRRAKEGTTKEIDDFTKDVLKEVNNILVGAYLTSLSNLTGFNLIESTPNLTVGTIDDSLRKAIEVFNGNITEVVVIETCLIIGKQRFKEELILMLDPQTLDILFKKLFKELE